MFKIKYFLQLVFCCIIASFLLAIKPHNWGFFGHQRINQLAVFTLPPEMIGFYKQNIDYITENAVNPDQRRYVVKNEAPRHFIDLDNYADSTQQQLPKLYWKEAVSIFSEDTLLKHGIVPWHIQLMKYQLTEAFKNKDVKKILLVSTDLGHYIADANVPLHTTRNYNGQLSNQVGIHGFWESRLPELFSDDYDFFVGQASYIDSPAKAAWRAVSDAHIALDSVLLFEKQLSLKISEDKKYSIEERNGQMIRVYSKEFSEKYHSMLKNQVENRMKASIKMVGDFWLTCWVDAGQPDLSKLGKYVAGEEEKQATVNEKKSWLKRIFEVRNEND